MSRFLRFGDNTALIVCGLLLLLVVIFFVIIYVADFKESRQKARKRREFQRAMAHSQRRKQKAH
jgi:hypothetical protein